MWLCIDEEGGGGGLVSCLSTLCAPFNQQGVGVQAERQRLDGLRTRWLAETRRKNKARDAEKRAAAEAEKAKYREKNDTEDMLVK